jgi:hypothetical protein
MSAPLRWAILATALVATLTAGVATSALNQPFKARKRLS